MRIKSYYINIRRRWSLIPALWNKFFYNLSVDYSNLKEEIDEHAINNSESYLQEKIEYIITKE